MVTSLPSKADQYFIDQLLVPNWDAANVRGYDVDQTDPDAEDFLPVATSIADVGAVYPSIIASGGDEPAGGGTSYDYLGSDGPGQRRTGQLQVTIRAEAGTDYVGDSTTYSSADAETIVAELAQEVERICIDNPTGDTSEFQFVGSGWPDVPDDDEAGSGEVVRIEQITVTYQWLRT